MRQIDRSAPGGPFYLQLDYNAPHGDSSAPIGPEPARRHWDSAIDTPLPRPPGFNEADISDKPSFIRDDAEPLGPTDFRRMRIEYQKSLESLRSVDEGVRPADRRPATQRRALPHLRLLHLRQRLLLRRAPAGPLEVPAV